MKPMVLTIPSNPIEINLKQGNKNDIVPINNKWSFCVYGDDVNEENEGSLENE